MYPEFILIYVGLIIVIALLVFAILKLSAILKFFDGNMAQPKMREKKQPQVAGNFAKSSGVVFCKNCGTQFDAGSRICPKCGTFR